MRCLSLVCVVWLILFRILYNFFNVCLLLKKGLADHPMHAPLNPPMSMVEKENPPVPTLVKRNLSLRRIVSASSYDVYLS